MARSAFIAAALAGLAAGTPAAAAQQAAAPEAPAVPNVVAPPAAVVSGHTVTHAKTGRTIRVPETASYVGSERFDLYGIADAEIQLFAEADANRKLTRLYWIQFEEIWPSKPTTTHDYTGDRVEQIWGTAFRVRSDPSRQSIPAKPGSDTERVRALLERAGYTRPDALMNVRMVELLDDPEGTGHGREELMLIYSEDLAPTGKTVEELTTPAGPTEAYTPIETALFARAVKAFSVEKK